MKFVLLLLAVLVLLWLLRGGMRRRARPSSTSAAQPPQAMLRCAQCGTHLPRHDALPGRGGVFCDAAHRSTYEAAHPGT